MTVTAYMMELYNEKLIDLFAKPNVYDEVSATFHKGSLLFVFACVFLMMTGGFLIILDSQFRIFL